MPFKVNEEFVLPPLQCVYGDLSLSQLKDVFAPDFLKHEHKNVIKNRIHEYINNERQCDNKNKDLTYDFGIWVGISEGEISPTVKYEHNYNAINTCRSNLFNNIYGREIKDKYIEDFERLSTDYIKSDEAKEQIKIFNKQREDCMKKMYDYGHKPKWLFRAQYQEIIIGNNERRESYQLGDIPITAQCRLKKSQLDNLESIIDLNKFDVYEAQFGNGEQKNMRELITTILMEKWSDAKDIRVSTVDVHDENGKIYRETGNFDIDEDRYGGNTRTMNFTATFEDGYRQYLNIATKRGIESFGTGETKILLTDSDILSMAEGEIRTNPKKLWVAKHKFNPKKLVLLNDLINIIGMITCNRNFLLMRDLDENDKGCRIHVYDPNLELDKSKSSFIPKNYIICALIKFYMICEYNVQDPYKIHLEKYNQEQSIHKCFVNDFWKMYFHEHEQQKYEMQILDEETHNYLHLISVLLAL